MTMQEARERVAKYAEWEAAIASGSTNMAFEQWLTVLSLPEPIDCPHPFELIRVVGRHGLECTLCGATRQSHA